MNSSVNQGDRNNSNAQDLSFAFNNSKVDNVLQLNNSRAENSQGNHDMSLILNKSKVERAPNCNPDLSIILNNSKTEKDKGTDINVDVSMILGEVSAPSNVPDTSIQFEDKEQLSKMQPEEIDYADMLGFNEEISPINQEIAVNTSFTFE